MPHAIKQRSKPEDYLKPYLYFTKYTSDWDFNTDLNSNKFNKNYY